MNRWTHGDTLVRREVLGYEPTGTVSSDHWWYERSWLDMPVRVVEDSDEALALYIPRGQWFDFPPGDWPAVDGVHPWHGRGGWDGNGCLMVQVPGEHVAVWHFWEGPDRRFACWYLNIQTAFRRTPDGVDTQDLELDLVVFADTTWQMKDWDLVDEKVRWDILTPEAAAWVRDYGTALGRRLDEEGIWWDRSWAEWEPPAAWDGEP